MSVRRAWRAVGLIVAVVLTFLFTVTVLRVTDGLTGSPTALRTGIADVVSCVEHGPVSRWGFGTSHGCTADVRWAGGDVERLDFVAGQLSPGERDVPVFLSSSGRQIAPSPGRNDSAALVPIGVTAGVLLGLCTLWLAIRATLAVLRLFRGEPRARPARRAEQWPVTAPEIAAAPPAKLAGRLRLLAGSAGLALLLAMIGSYAQFDAPRQDPFVSPWPQVERSWLTGLPHAFFVFLGLALLLFCLLAASGVRRDSARVVRYGEPYLLRLARDKRQRARFRANYAGAVRERGQARIASRLFGVLLLALGCWAVLDALGTLPGYAPVPAWCGALRDAALLLGAGLAWLLTVQPKAERIQALLRLHEDRVSAAGARAPRQSGAAPDTAE